MEAPEEARRCPTPSSGGEGRARGIVDGVGHRGTWATFEKLKEKYLWPGFYLDVHQFVTTCESCQMHSIVRHRDGGSHDRPLQVDGGSRDDEDGGRRDAVLGASMRGFDEPSRGSCVTEQDDYGRVPVPNRTSGMPIRVHREDRSGPWRTRCTRSRRVV